MIKRRPAGNREELAPRRWLGSPALLVALLAAALFLPRLPDLLQLRHPCLLPSDMIPHLLTADQLCKELRLDTAGRVDQDSTASFGDRAEGTYYAACPWVTLLGPLSIWTPQATNLPFMLVLFAGVVGLGLRAGGLRLGLWAAILCALCPPLVAGGWYFGPDLPLAAMVTVGLLLLQECRLFQRRNSGLLFGVWSALGMFIKHTYGLYLAGPALCCLVLLLRRRDRAILAMNAALALGCFAGLSWTLEPTLWSQALGELVAHAAPSDLPAAGGFGFPTPGWFLAYPLFAALSFPLPLLLLALPGFARLHTRAPLPGRWIWLAAIWGTYLLLTLLPNKLERYLLPLYPLACLLMAWSAQALPPRVRRATLAGVTACFCAVLLAVHHVPTPWFIGQGDAARALVGGRAGIPGPEQLMTRFELQLPSRGEVRKMQRSRFHPECQLDALDRAMAKVAARDPAQGPVGVQVRTSLGSLEERVINSGLPALMLAQRLRGRQVVHLQSEQGVDAWLARAGESLVMISEAAWPGAPPRARAAAQASCQIRCGQSSMDLRVVRYAAAPAP